MIDDGSSDISEREIEYLESLQRDIAAGKSLEDATAQLSRWLQREPEQLELIQRAAKRLRSRIDSIEHLRIPFGLRAKGRTKWYPGPNDSDRFWPPLKKFLVEDKNWPLEPVVNSLDSCSSKIISSLDFPGRARFSTRGLVVGYVQSGKTANFTAVISKAADVGFRLIIVLSGLTNSLRQQTQQRLNQELVRHNAMHWMTWTDEASDIGDLPFDVNALLNGQHRHLAVVKKNGPRLRRLLRMVRQADSRIREACPVLIIDDECDQASVNASGAQERFTAINRLLRNLISELPRVAYVGYTATPFANVLIDPSYEEDLYPRDFIVALPKPDGYFGAETLFGRDLLDADEVPPNEDGLDVIRLIPADEATLLRPASRAVKDTFSIAMSESLRQAVLYYWLATAAKAVRGLDHQHSSMLIHNTVYAQSHINSKPVIERFRDGVIELLATKDTSLLEELRSLWLLECEKVPAEILGCAPVSFDTLLVELRRCIEQTEVRVENMRSDVRLDYSSPGRKYIVIGGNVLARGLTVEGLIVSFFLRTSSQYDSLMQMGRWFGYRQGYEDLPRIWMTSDMAGYFKDMATVEAELRYDIETYDREELTPLDFAVRVREHPVLAVTAKNKMTAAVQCSISFSGEHLQTRKFRHEDAEWLESNWRAGSDLVTRLSSSGVSKRELQQTTVFENAPFHEVIAFLRNYIVHEAHDVMSSERLIEYIVSQNSRAPSALTVWNVAVIGTNDGQASERTLGSLGHVKTVIRARLKLTGENDADIKALMTRTDATVDLPDRTALKNLSWDEIKAQRHATFHEGRPLLLLYPINRLSPPQREKSNRESLSAVSDVLGVAIIFPRASVTTAVSYVRAPIDVSRFEQAEYEEEQIDAEAN